MTHEETTHSAGAEQPDGELRAALGHLLDAHRSLTFISHDYHDLPPREEMRESRVATIYNVGGEPEPPAARLIGVHGLGRLEKGQHIIVPAGFPARCDVHITGQGVYAVARVGDEYHSFVVRPQATAEGAWEAYEREREWMRGDADRIGRVYRPRRLERFTRPSDAEIAALISKYTTAEVLSGRAGATPLALAAYRHPDASADDPLHLGAQLAFALALCAKSRRYTGIFLPEGAEADIPALLDFARALDDDARTGVTSGMRNCLAAGINSRDYTHVGVLTEVNAHDTDRVGHDYVTLVTRGGREALFSGVRPGSEYLFTAVVAAPGSFPDGAAARDQLVRHFRRAHLALVWTDAPPPASAPPADYQLTDTLVTYDARHLPGSRV